MIYKSIADIKEGDTLGETLCTHDNKILTKGTHLSQLHIQKLKHDGIFGCYISNDDLIKLATKELPLISHVLNTNMVELIKHIYLAPEHLHINNITQVAESILSNVSKNNDILLNIADIKLYDDYTYSHCVNVAIISAAVGFSLELSEDNLMELIISALLHDIGKVFVPLTILNKKGKLNAEEYTEMKRHSEYGYEHVKNTHYYSKQILKAILEHHERYDGKGYPEKLKSTEISQMGRILTVADVYDALVSKRPYRRALPVSEAVEHIMANGATLFDPCVVRAFLKRVCPYPVGSTVLLSTGETAYVIANTVDHTLRPVIGILNGSVVDLSVNKKYLNVTIMGVVNSVASRVGD